VSEPIHPRYEQLVAQVKLLMKAEQRLVRAQRVVESQVRRFRALDAFALAAPRSRTLRDLLDRVVELLRPIFSVQAALAVLYRPEREGPPQLLACRVDLLREVGPEEAGTGVAAAAWPARTVLLERAPQEGGAGLLSTLLDELAPAERWEQRARRHGRLLMPLGSGPGSGPAALLLCRCAGVSGREETPTQADEAFLELVRSHATSALEIAALHADLEQRVETRTLDLAVANEQLRVGLQTLRQTQAQLVDASRLAAVGQLASAVAHDIANPLSALKANVCWLGRSEPSPGGAEERAEVLADALSSIGRITESVWKLRQLAERSREG
jgi:hypothetical protein